MILKNLFIVLFSKVDTVNLGEYILSMGNKEKLIMAGFEVLKQKQNDDFSLREIARKCNLSHNTPYKHFSSKKEFLGEMAKIALANLENRLSTDHIQKDSVKVKVRCICHNYLNYFIENPEHLIFFFQYGESVEIQHGTITASDLHNFSRIKKILIPLYKDVSTAEKRALMLWNFIHGLTVMLIQNKIIFSLTKEQTLYIDESIDLLLGVNDE